MCRIWLAGPQAAELWWIEGELRRIDDARSWLFGRRRVLLAELVQLAQAAASPQVAPSPQVGPPAPSPGYEASSHGEATRDAAPAGRPELSGRAVARVLLVVGAMLVVIAAGAFTLANWSRIGPLGRSSILLAVTALVLAVPRQLIKRGLKATAESVAAIGLALTVADAYLLERLVLHGQLIGPFVAAAATAVLAGLWGAYGAFSRAQVPRLAAIVIAQLPGLFVAEGAARSIGMRGVAVGGPLALAFALTAGVDCALARWAGRRERRAEYLTISITAVVTAVAGILLATAAAVDALPATSGVPWLACTFVVSAVVGLAAMPRSVGWLPAGAVFVGSGVLLTTGLASAATLMLPSRWVSVAFATTATAVSVTGLLVATLAAEKEKAGRPRLVAVGAAAVGLAALAGPGRWLARALFNPFKQFEHAWTGHAEAILRAARSPALPLAVIALAGCTVAIIAAAGAWRGRHASVVVAAVASPLVIAPACVAVGLSYGLIVAVLLTLAVALAAWSVASNSVAPALSALATSVLAVAWAVASPRATLIALVVAASASAVAAWRSRLVAVRTVASCAAVLGAAAFAACAVLASHRPSWEAGVVTLGAGASAQVVAAWLSGGIADAAGSPGARRSVRVGVEVSGWLTAATGVALCFDQAGLISLGLAVCGLTCICVAAQDDRRPALWVGIALCQAALFVWLAASGVTAPEPYTVPAAVALLGFGWHLARRRLEARSWLTYGPGLALLLVPSLLTLWQAHGWVRPLLVGIAAAAVTLIGARFRQQAPLLIGGAVAVLDAGHELAPEVRRLFQALPGWVPIAVIGAILLWAGATYEARLRNVRAVRQSLAGMR